MTDQLRLDLARRHHPLNEPLLTPRDAADLLAVRVSWIYEAVRDGRLPCIRVGRHIRFLREDLEQWVGDQRESGRARPRPTPLPTPSPAPWAPSPRRAAGS